MGLSVELVYQPQRCGDNKMCIIYDDAVWEKDITHNLSQMAEKAQLHDVLWYPERLNIKQAEQAIPYLEKGLKILVNNKIQLQQFNPENGHGTYKELLDFTTEYLNNCRQYPDSKIYITR